MQEQDGAKGIQVGARIAVLAEPDDDISSLEMPADKSSSSSAPAPPKPESTTASDLPKDEQSTPGTTSNPAPSSSASTSSASKPSSPPSQSSSGKKYPLYPSVSQLLSISNISASDAAKIPASGPSGRLLKGDVLAYLGRIAKDYSANQSARLAKLGHLDLSNIKIATPNPHKTAAAAKTPAAAAPTPAPEELPTEIAVSISLAAVFATQKRIQDSLGLTLPLSTFIARASELANEELPRAKSDALSSDALFNAVLGLDKVPGHSVSRGHYIPQITALPPAGVAAGLGLAAAGRASRGVDIIDVLAGKSTKKTGAMRTALPAGTKGVLGGSAGAAGATNVFSVAAKKGEEKRVRTYLERVKTVLEVEPGRCVL